MIMGFSIWNQDEALGYKLFREWLGPALAEGKFKPNPDPEVVGTDSKRSSKV
jgi:hypothetical protein